MYYLKPEEITALHVEVTNLCNAACPMCARNNSGYGLTENPGWGSWGEKDALRVFTDELVNLKLVDFCGTHGDPLAAPNFLDSLRVCKSRNIPVSIFTNASLRSIKWWEEFLSLLSEDDLLTFSVDGYETNHLYRQNTDINTIMTRMKMACESKVTVGWDYVVFEHNEHELDFCKKLAQDMGVKQFRVRKTSRFNVNPSNAWPVKNKNNIVTHYLKPPKDISLRHPDFVKMQDMKRTHPTTLDYNINCLYKSQQRMYVNSRLEVFPCCYISDENEKVKLNKDSTQIKVPLSEFNLRKYSWGEILNTDFYRELFMKSLVSDNVLHRCIMNCGVVERDKNQNEKIILK